MAKFSYFKGKSAVYDLITNDVYIASAQIPEAIAGYEQFISLYSGKGDPDKSDLTDYYRYKIYPYYILAKIYKLFGENAKSLKYAKIALKNNVDPTRDKEISILI